MRRLPNFTRTMVAVLTVCVLMFTCMMYFVSGALARSTVRRVAQSEADQAMRDGLALLASGAEADALQSAVAPAVNPAEVRLLLLDSEGQVLAASPRLAEQTDEIRRFAAEQTEDSGLLQREEMMLAWGRGPGGAAVAVKPLDEVRLAEGSFRSLMLPYALLGLLFMGVAVGLLALRIMAPVDTLVQAARRISDGDEIEISEKLPVELRPLGRAFNQMSHRLSRSLSELTYERDTLSQVLESLDEGVLAVDRQGDVLRENRAAPRLLGGRDSAEYARVLGILRKGGQTVPEPQQMQIGERTVLAVFRPLAEAGALAVLRDVTENERLERTRRNYVANISHELRTPLSSRLSRLVNDLLELSNLQSSPAAFSTERVDALETLYDLHDRTRTLAQAKGVTLALDVPEELPQVITNEDRLQQVLTILLDNAIKFTPAGGSVTLGAMQEGRHVRFSVRDTGIGMDEYTVQHAFDRFHQADPSHGAKGSGLGLAIAQEIMARLGSRILIKSKPGEGSEFAFLIRTE